MTDGVRRSSCTRAQVESSVDVGDVTVHGVLAEVQLGGDLAVAEPARDQADHVDLTLGERAVNDSVRALTQWRQHRERQRPVLARPHVITPEEQCLGELQPRVGLVEGQTGDAEVPDGVLPQLDDIPLVAETRLRRVRVGNDRRSADPGCDATQLLGRRARLDLFGERDVHINIFNISKINSEVRGGKSPRIKRLSEYIGESYFAYLAGLPDLVLIMDESHRYRASSGVRAINELKPLLGLELTATPFTESPKGAVAFKNVIFDYPLGKAMDDGFVKQPAVVTRKDFDPKGMTTEAIERLKLEDGVRMHEQTKVLLETYAREADVKIVKPFVLIISRDTTHAKQLLDLIQSEEFFEGRYKTKVIQVDSSKTGAEEDEMVERLLKVEHNDEPTEIVIHVNMLKEGWDVTNLYTIVPLRAANGQMVPLSELVQVETGIIDKPLFTKDLQGVSYVFGDMAGKLDSPLYGLFAIRDRLQHAALPGTGELGEYWINQPSDPYRQYSVKWDGEWQITYDTFRDMGAAYGVGLILIYLLVVAQFRSYLTPLVIMAPIPLTIIGVMPGHALMGAQYTATSMIGMIALAGIIVRNSILLVDFINLQVREGVPFKEAIVNSAITRAQPIVLTGLAAMIGAFFILDDPIFNGLAISLIFGILVSTLLTLVVIPVLYYALYWRRMEARTDAPVSLDKAH